MSYFNAENKQNNIIKSSLWAAITNMIAILVGFASRSVFIYVLSAEYLGLSGLFTNVLQILSFSELGISTAIIFRFYDPISRDDIEQVGRLMRYFRDVYLYIAGTITALGLLILPFVRYMISADSIIPEDVNVYIIYLLFLMSTVVSYLFSYKQTMLNVDQKNYVVSGFQIILSIVKSFVQIILLLFFRNYTLMLVANIAVTVVSNCFFNLYIEKRYREVFAVKQSITAHERSEIMSDTKACLLHKLGGTVLSSTDSIIITKLINITVNGLYSNYTMIVHYIHVLLEQVLCSFVSSIGIVRYEASSEKCYDIYSKLFFLNLWISSVISTCLYLIINNFVDLWVGKKYELSEMTVTFVCVLFFLSESRLINGSYTNACGLFVKDRIRPIIEAVLNLAISLVLVFIWGVNGVILGSIFSIMLTVWWREPLILYKHEFGRSVKEYWETYLKFGVSALAVGGCLNVIYDHINVLAVSSWLILFIKSIASFLIINFVLFIIYWKDERFLYFARLANSYAIKIMKLLDRKRYNA